MKILYLSPGLEVDRTIYPRGYTIHRGNTVCNERKMRK
jgi:hypothetical protein